MSDIKVREVMSRSDGTVTRKASLLEAVQVMAEQDVTVVPVLDEGDARLVGLLTEPDVIRMTIPVRSGSSVLSRFAFFLTAKQPPGTTAGDLAHRVPATTSPGADFWDAVRAMEQSGLEELPVVDDGLLIGMMRRRDVIQLLARDDATIRQHVVHALAKLGPEVVAHIHVRVEGGTAVLRGKVDRRSTKDLAVRLTSRIPGVFSVSDELHYEMDDSDVTSGPGQLGGSRSDPRATPPRVGPY
jgi:CBS domain-containing protein